MLTFDQIKELIELVAEHGLSGIELERSGFRLKVEGEQAIAPAAAVAAAPAAPAPAPLPASTAASPAPAAAPPATPAGQEEPAEELAANVHVLNSPIVGTFYRRPNPDADPFVDEGERVKQGQVLCIVEAMKLMNEIESDVDGVVVKVFPKNAQPVEFGEPLFAIEPD